MNPIHRSTILFFIIAVAGCDGKSDVRSYDDCILKYVKPSMTEEATHAVQTSCYRKFPESAPAILPTGEGQEISASKRDQCLAKAEGDVLILAGKAFQHFDHCGKATESLTREQIKECSDLVDAIEAEQKQREDRCIRLYPQ